CSLVTAQARPDRWRVPLRLHSAKPAESPSPEVVTGVSAATGPPHWGRPVSLRLSRRSGRRDRPLLAVAAVAEDEHAAEADHREGECGAGADPGVTPVKARVGRDGHDRG